MCLTGTVPVEDGLLGDGFKAICCGIFTWYKKAAELDIAGLNFHGIFREIVIFEACRESVMEVVVN